MLGTFPSRDRLLVGKDISELDGFADQIKTAVISGIVLIFLLAGREHPRDAPDRGAD